MASLTPAAHYMGMEINKGEIEEAFPGRSVTLTHDLIKHYGILRNKVDNSRVPNFLIVYF